MNVTDVTVVAETAPVVPETPVTETVAPVVPEPVLVGTAAQDAEKEAEDANREADKVLRACSKSYRGGERAYRAGLLESGMLADKYIRMRMLPPINHSRKAAMNTVQLELGRYASETVDVNRLISAYHAYRLLAIETGLDAKDGKKPPVAETMSYGHFKAAWCLVVERVKPGTPEETWVLLEGQEQACRDAFKHAAETDMSRGDCETKVKAIIAEQARVREELRRQDAQKAADAAKAAKAALDAERAKCSAIAQAAEQEADATKKAELDAALKAQQAVAAKVAAQESIATRNVAVAQAEVVKAETAVKRAEERQDKAEERKIAKTVASTVKAKQGDGKLENLLKGAAMGTVKDAAEMAAEIITGHPAPDDVLEQLLKLVIANGDCSAIGKRACQAALVVLSNNAKANPVNVSAQLAARGGIAVAVPA